MKDASECDQISCTPPSGRWLFTPPILTLPVDVGCLSFLRFLGEGKLSREEGKVWEGEKCECERDMVQSHTERANSLRSVRSLYTEVVELGFGQRLVVNGLHGGTAYTS